MARISMYNTKYEVDPAAISMSLAEGLVSRFRREYRGNREGVVLIYRKLTAKRIYRRGTLLRNIEDELRKAGFLYFQANDRFTVLTCETTPVPGFYTSIIAIKNNQLNCGSRMVCITPHAVARFIYRQRETDWLKVLEEFGAPAHYASLKLDMENVEQTNIRTEHGWMVCEDTTEEAEGVPCAIIKTWVNKEILRPEQIVDVFKPGDLFMRSVKDVESVIDHFKISPRSLKKLHGFYQRKGGLLSYEEFIASNESIVNIMAEAYNLYGMNAKLLEMEEFNE